MLVVDIGAWPSNLGFAARWLSHTTAASRHDHLPSQSSSPSPAMGLSNVLSCLVTLDTLLPLNLTFAFPTSHIATGRRRKRYRI
ncbi:hypothetical protein E4U40_004241 [Claviceps sp. LM458 group G5]|nr:hypothetical protein E4U40_004241 [Claviceps sp. LM458 group G5]